jgi:acylpyruvate hydrolase
LEEGKMTSPQICPQIWAVGRNYADHAKELGNAVPEAAGDPMIFLKGGGTIVQVGNLIHLPKWTSDVHHECELALRFDDKLQFSHLTIALDLTAREVQAKLKAQGHPWTLAKSFRDSCPLGEPIAISSIPGGADGIVNLNFSLKVNGELRQKASPRQMIHSIQKLREYVVDRFPVQPGDWLLTGTPAGVAPLRSGDDVEAVIDGVYRATWTVA